MGSMPKEGSVLCAGSQFVPARKFQSPTSRMAGMPEMMRYTDMTRTNAIATRPQTTKTPFMTPSMASLTPRLESMPAAGLSGLKTLPTSAASAFLLRVEAFMPPSPFVMVSFMLFLAFRGGSDRRSGYKRPSDTPLFTGQ